MTTSISNEIISSPSPPPYKDGVEEVDEMELEFVPTYDQEQEFDFDLLNREIEDELPTYTTESLQEYFHKHFFLYQGYVYLWAGEQVDTNHEFFKKPQTIKKTIKWFSEQRGRTWDEAMNIGKTIPNRTTLSKDLALNIPLDITEFPNIQPILDFDLDMCNEDPRQMKLFHQMLGMKLKYPTDIKRLSDKFIVFSGPEGGGKTVVMSHKLNKVFNQQPYPAHMKDYGNKKIYKHATALNIIIDDAYSAKTTAAQTNTVKEMTSKPLVGGNIKNRSTTWFFVNDDSMHNIPMQQGRRCHIFRTGSEYNRDWDRQKIVKDTTTKYRDEYVAYLLSTVEGLENLNGSFGDYEQQELVSNKHVVETDPSDLPPARIRNWFKQDMLTNPKKYTNLPYKLPNAKQIVAETQEMYESSNKHGMTSAVTGLIKAVVPELRKNNKKALYVIDTVKQLKSLATCCKIFGNNFDSVFFPEPESESDDEPEPDDEKVTITDGIDLEEENAMLEWQQAKQEEIKQDQARQANQEVELLKMQLKMQQQQMEMQQRQMEQGMAMFQQMQEQMAQMQQPVVPRPIKALMPPKAKQESPKQESPKQEGIPRKIKFSLKKK